MGGARPRLLTRAPSCDGAVERPRLLATARSGRVVAISAPEGSGVSTLAAQLAVDGGAQVAWCRLTAGFDRFADVVEMVAATVGVDASAPTVLAAVDQLLDMYEAGPLTVVIDDHHLAADGEIDRMIAELAALLPADGRIIVAGAVRPAGLIGRVPPDSLTLLGAGDLAFTRAEAVSLFEQVGSDAARAADWVDQLGGWAQGIAAGAYAPDASPADVVGVAVERLVADHPDSAPLVDAAAALPYLTDALVDALGLGDSTATSWIQDIASTSPLFTADGEYIGMIDAAATRHLATLPVEFVRSTRITAATALADSDPTTAIDVFLDAGEPDAAADVLADHLTEIGVERALTWLYRLPGELRRRFPPVLAAGQATVEVDAALATAEARVEAATTDRSRREALFALGSIERHRGELAAAAGAFEGALRSAADDHDTGVRITAELATVRWLLGDRLGSRSALDHAGDTPENRWLRAQLDVLDRRTTLLAMAPTGEPFTDASMALVALDADDLALAARASESAYVAAVAGGGDALLAAAVTRAWTQLRTGGLDEALTTVDELERRLGPRHELARVHGAIVRERVSRAGGDRGHHERDERRLHDLRNRGYAAIEALADQILDPSADATAAPSVIVTVLGEHSATVADRRIRRSDWKSKKAFEVLTVLAAHGARGARREQIIEAVWPGRPPEKGRTLLRTALSEIRKVVEPSRPTGEPSRYVSTSEDVIALDGALDLDLADELTARDPTAAFAELVPGLAPEVMSAEWAAEWPARVDRLTIAAATQIPPEADPALRVQALDALITAEPWQRSHYDALAELHRSHGDEPAAADIERRWFADD